jgi:hypothetical protein
LIWPMSLPLGRLPKICDGGHHLTRQGRHQTPWS